MAEEIILEEPEEQPEEQKSENVIDDNVDDGFEDLQGKAGEAPEEDELTSLDDGGGGFNFTRETAPVEKPAPVEDEPTYEESYDSNSDVWYKDKKFMYLLGLCISVVCILVFVLFYLSFDDGQIRADYVATKVVETGVVSIDESYNYNDMTKIDSMIQKANTLYLRGEVEQALKLYEQVSVYNESLSNYNLGVSQMNDGDFAHAFDSFKKAIANGEHQSVSCINAAVCSLILGDSEKFKYYIDLAEVYLPKEGNSKLYGYYLSLINYYKGYYPEALQMLQKVNVEPYTDTAKYLSAKIFTKLDLTNKAIEALNTQGSYESSLSLGLLYAKIGEFEKAKTALNTAMKIDRDFNKSLAAINLVDLKMGNYQNVLARLNASFNTDLERYKILDMHKIKVNLNKELFNIHLAQGNFSKDLLQNPEDQFDLLFYFAPYQVFDSKQASLYIKKANIIGFVEDSEGNENYLNIGKTLSSTNIKIANIINLALNQQLRQANLQFQALLNDYPEHSILHYNLGLTYAQLKNYDQAYKHFSSSYHLNPKNYQAGAFAMFAAKLSGIDTAKLFNEILENIASDKEFKANLQRSMLFLANSNHAAMIPYLEENKDDSPLSLMFDVIIAKTNNLSQVLDTKIDQLRSALPEDILTNILYFNAKNENLNIQEYAQNAQIYFENLKLDYRSIFGGANVAREMYVSLMQVSGLLNIERQKFKKLANASTKNEEGVIQTLAYLDIFAGQYQEAYALYSMLIDEYNVQDSRTLFLAAVAATGADNPNSAIALLQLSKLSDRTNRESKVALGLLYQEAQNYEPALNQYKELPNNFKSKFFSFDISQS
ncbi:MULTISPECIES: tetratricopeptide repeat protein [unclassified Campylobacter]|uniref:tetratricopeptide repeat protein n=1 Tax=unclassified Campylobacter TaxID=2593542 RepID=UPI001237B2C2|nr:MULTISPECIES: tetratricopeptide repeat protein [unclassified Campylobacter]KAA6226403.1 tetratricopeptide repeat protein [Campylobacter sp. LR286c]KAA6226891.1 tetratricopeptide repeat protein [Campylobacter sp. LR196d]